MKKVSDPAYFLIDMDELDPEVMLELRNDALNGNGANYGVKVVEYAMNGPAQVPIYGVYYGADHDKFVEAGDEFHFDPESIASTDILQKARAEAAATAAVVNAHEDAEVEAVTGDDKTAVTGNKTTGSKLAK